MPARLNIFGFLATADLYTEHGQAGNYGIMDQQLALKWVKSHIGYFNGDPARLTLLGQSSGGTSILALLCSPASAGLFSAAISLSGSPNITMDLPTAIVQNAPLISAAGCGGYTTPAERLACMNAAPPSVLVSVIPSSWNGPGMFGLPSSPDGDNYTGLVIVDGSVLTHDILTALALPVVDVPLIFGNMGFEPDAAPAKIVSGFSAAQWADFLDAKYAGWPNRTMGRGVLAQYQSDSAPDPQRAYDAISSDVGLSCASIDIARAALPPIGNFRSPMYIFVNNWDPAKPVPGWLPHYYATFAFHTWDLVCALEHWAAAKYEPQPADELHGQLLRTWWYQLAAYGRLNATAAPGWVPVNSVPGWPDTWGTFVIQQNTSAAHGGHGGTSVASPADNLDHGDEAALDTIMNLTVNLKPASGGSAASASVPATVTAAPPPRSGSAMATNYKRTQCSLWAANGVDQRYWWCN